MRFATELCRLYSGVRRPVLLVGPVGAGKTRLANLVHTWSGRQGPMVTMSAGEATLSLYQDSLFGHVAGAFTGAGTARKGVFERAAGGTLLFDDVAFMPMEAQAAVLRALEERRFLPIGAARDLPVTCREIYATTVPPDVLVEKGKMLPDLVSRVGELVVEVPGLTERPGEIPGLAQGLARSFSREHKLRGEIEFSDDVMSSFLGYSWPKNVRELKGVVERAVIHASVEPGPLRVEVRHLPDRLQSDVRPLECGDGKAPLSPSLIQWALSESGGNKSEAARRLGVHRNTIARHIKTVG